MKITIEKGIIGYVKNCDTYKIMLDKRDGKVWIDVFASENEWNQYHSDDIVVLCSGTGSRSIWGLTKRTLAEIRELAKQAI